MLSGKSGYGALDMNSGCIIRLCYVGKFVAVGVACIELDHVSSAAAGLPWQGTSDNP